MFLPSSVIIIFIAFSGFLLAAYIRHKKVYKEVLICPLGSSCETVIFSKYSRFLGIPVEILGIAYYLITAASYSVFLFVSVDMPRFLLSGIFFATIAAFFFSLYLTYIQAFTLKQWCIWCLVSAGFCTIIFFLALLGI
ncbi:MAG: vitamin K epoxide reductase family protein [Candidatus Yanofskybacteria bacterium]|nr:vitamin K epoxide reductase family protein [Candidatus Yanofskybacteria bacterium]